jgi:hypothetical protein
MAHSKKVATPSSALSLYIVGISTGRDAYWAVSRSLVRAAFENPGGMLSLRCNPRSNVKLNGGRRPLLLQLRPRPAAGVSVCLSKEPLPAGLLFTWQGGGARGQGVPRAARAARTAVSENVTGPAPRSVHSVRGFAGELLGTIKRMLGP